MEHQKGRVMVGELADAIRGYAAGEPPAQENLVKSLRALVAFYPSHIWKEDYLLFPLAGKRVWTPEPTGLNGHGWSPPAQSPLRREWPKEKVYGDSTKP